MALSPTRKCCTSSSGSCCTTGTSSATEESTSPSILLVFENQRIRNAYIALQAWKQAILSDPNNFTVNWVGSNVCNYTGVFCTRALDDPKIRTLDNAITILLSIIFFPSLLLFLSSFQCTGRFPVL
ncbi:hypothetical protein SLA2020_194840 [Shorea laevis]